MSAKIIRWLLPVGLTLTIGGILLFLLLWNGVILFNHPSREQYPVRGVDVSSYQGEIDWAVLASQDISFAFIKATEGSSYTDPYFTRNFEQARQQSIALGAYHFFSFDSPGKTQAEHFIQTVIPFPGMLPPVIDLEFYGEKEENPPPREEVCRQLNDMLARLENHYGIAPIIYATEDSYERYLAGGYEDYDIWIRNVFTFPHLEDDRSFTFWQFTNRERLEGYRGKERYIDMNVFHGSFEEWEAYPRYRDPM